MTMKQRMICFLVLLPLTAVLTITTSAHDDHNKPSPTPQESNGVPSANPSPVTAGHEHVEMSEPTTVVTDFPNYHPLVVHFPIVLLMGAVVFQVLSLFAYKNEFSVAVLILLFLGTVSVWLASNTFHAHPANLPDHLSQLYETHELMAKITWWLSLAALGSKVVSHFFLKRRWWSEAIVLVLLIGASITVAIAGHHGAELVHIGGVGPQGKYLESR